jgi:hypothetical protein
VGVLLATGYGGQKMSTNCAEIMAEGYGKKACHKKINANSLSLSLSLFLSRFLFSVSLSSNSASVFFSYSIKHIAEKIMPKAGIEPLTSR